MNDLLVCGHFSDRAHGNNMHPPLPPHTHRHPIPHTIYPPLPQAPQTTPTPYHPHPLPLPPHPPDLSSSPFCLQIVTVTGNISINTRVLIVVLCMSCQGATYGIIFKCVVTYVICQKFSLM